MSEEHPNASAYAGRWVARIRGRIVAQGDSADQALQAAKKSRHKEKIEIIYMSLPFVFSPLIDKVRDTLPGVLIHLVGGAVRDMLLERTSPDLDFVLPAGGITNARKVANALHADFMVLDDERDTARVIHTDADGNRTFLDFAVYRGGNLEEDLRNRDFTFNAIAYDLHDQTLFDPLNGGADLRANLIRACSPSSIKDDPIRILRGIRQAAVFECKIELETRKAMKQNAGLLLNVSSERKRDELFKILEGPKPDAAMRALELLGVFPHLLPELTGMRNVTQSAPHTLNVWEHTLRVIGYLEQILSSMRVGYSADETKDLFTGLLTIRIGRFREQLAGHFEKTLNMDRSVRSALFFAALYHDVEKPNTKSVDESGRIRFFDHDIKGAEAAVSRARDLNLSKNEIERIKLIVRHHMRFHFFTSRLENDKQEPSRKAIYRFFRDAGEAGIDLVLLGLADLRGTQGVNLPQSTWTSALDVARILFENFWEKPEEIISPQRLINGDELMKELKLKPGQMVGHLLDAIREGQATGKITTREEAIQFAHTEIKRLDAK